MFILESLYVSYCLYSSIFFHPIHTKTTVCFTQVALKPTKLIVPTINMFLVFNRNFYLHIHKKIRFFTWNKDVGGLVEWLLAWSLPVHVVWICVLFERMAQYIHFLSNVESERFFIWARSLNQTLLFFCNLIFFTSKTQSTKYLEMEMTDSFVTLTVMGKVLFKIVTLFLTNKLTH